MQNNILNKNELIQALQAGLKVKYLFFWGHQSLNKESIGKQCLSQWYMASFEINNIRYPSAEHYMMAEKARLFNDQKLAQQILNAKHPGEAKALGRQIFKFDETLWEQHRFDIVVKGNIGKFQQNIRLKEFLLYTGDRILVEASPRDKIWGIGLTEKNPAASHPKDWPGLNLLGFALMKVRATLIG